VRLYVSGRAGQVTAASLRRGLEKLGMKAADEEVSQGGEARQRREGKGRGAKGHRGGHGLEAEEGMAMLQRRTPLTALLSATVSEPHP
jgi:hypothetical protein